jgi:DNA primase
MTSAEDIKAKLDIVEVLREYIQVKPAGRNFQALCPFHNEKSPSLVISPEKQIWHCFGCGKGGDVLTFVMEKEGLTFGETLRLLAPKAGVQLQEYSPEKASQKSRLLDILQTASAYFEQTLLNSREAEEARQYLVTRGLTDEIIEDWQIGFASDSWDDLILYLKSRGFNESDIFASGLTAQKAGTSRYFNRFRSRIMFPITDVNSNIVGFTARVLPSNDGKDGPPAQAGMGKYVNSPQSAVFDKSKLLFGLNRAKNAIREQGYVIIVEGQMDAITAHQFGFKNVVASSGTALTQEQIQLLDRFTNNLLFALDADNAGQMATDRAGEAIASFDVSVVEAPDRFGRLKRYIDPAKSYKKNIKVALMPSGKDPDECIRRDRAGWIRSLAEAKPLMQYYFDKILAPLDLRQASGKKQGAQSILPLIGRLPNPVERDAWLKKLSSLLDIDVKYLYEAMAELKPREGTRPPLTTVSFSPEATSHEAILSDYLLALVCRFPNYLVFIFENVLPEYLQSKSSQIIYNNLILYYNQSRDALSSGLNFILNYQNFRDWLLNSLVPESAQALDKLVILGEKEFSGFDETQASIEIKKIVNDLKRSYLNSRLKELTNLLADLEAQNGAKEELDSLLVEFNNLTQEIKKLLE